MTVRRFGARKQDRLDASFSDAFIFTVRGGPTAPGEARAQLEDRLDGRFPADLTETAKLLVSELVTNCVLHGGATADHSIEVSGCLQTRTLRLEVASDGPLFDHSPTRPDDLTAGGRGLYLVDALSETWGIGADAGRPSVWLELASN